MDLRQLRYFLSVAEAGSFSRACEQTGTAQAALSSQVGRLESHLGVRLLERNSRGVQLTREGMVLVERAKRILREVDAAQDAVRHASDEVHGRVSIGMPTTVSMILTLPLLASARARWPNVGLRLLEGHSGWLQEWLLADRIDGTILFGVASARGMSAVPLLDEDLFVVGPSDSPLGKSGADIALGDISALPLMLPAQGHGLRNVIDRATAMAETTLLVSIELDSFANIKKAVAAGLGHTILSWAAVAEELRRGELVARRIVNPKIVRTVVYAQRDDRLPSVAHQYLINAIQEQVTELVTSGRWRAKLRMPASLQDPLTNG